MAVDMKTSLFPVLTISAASWLLLAGIYLLPEPSPSICTIFGVLLFFAYGWFVIKWRKDGQAAVISTVTAILGPLAAATFIRGRHDLDPKYATESAIHIGQFFAQLATFCAGTIGVFIFIIGRGMSKSKNNGGNGIGLNYAGLDIAFGAVAVGFLFWLLGFGAFPGSTGKPGPMIDIISNPAPDFDKLFLARLVLIQFAVWASAHPEGKEGHADAKGGKDQS